MFHCVIIISYFQNRTVMLNVRIPYLLGLRKIRNENIVPLFLLLLEACKWLYVLVEELSHYHFSVILIAHRLYYYFLGFILN